MRFLERPEGGDYVPETVAVWTVALQAFESEAAAGAGLQPRGLCSGAPAVPLLSSAKQVWLSNWPKWTTLRGQADNFSL